MKTRRPENIPKIDVRICVRLRSLFKDRHNARFPLAYPFGDELGGQHGFACSRRPCDQETVALRNAPREVDKLTMSLMLPHR
jgi:hypothetical protein